MNALIICGASLRFSPYAFPYFDAFLKQGVNVSALVWIRDGQKDCSVDERVRIVHYDRYLKDTTHPIKKIPAFLDYRRFILQELSKKSYDFIVVFGAQFAVLLGDVLLRRFRDKYIYDMRDLSYERFAIYRKIVAKIVHHSACVFVSSDGYRQFLPKSSKIFTTHNIRTEDLDHIGARGIKHPGHLPLRISYWGCVREKELNKKIISILGNDARFFIQYYGADNDITNELNEFIKNSHITNVEFYGIYSPNDRYSFAQKTDILHNIYSSNTPSMSLAMGNKYYDGLIFQIPQMCSTATQMGSLVEKNKVGIAIDINDNNIGDKIISYYNSIDWTQFGESCQSTFSEVYSEYQTTNKVLAEIINKKPSIQ